MHWSPHHLLYLSADGAEFLLAGGVSSWSGRIQQLELPRASAVRWSCRIRRLELPIHPGRPTKPNCAVPLCMIMQPATAHTGFELSSTAAVRWSCRIRRLQLPSTAAVDCSCRIRQLQLPQSTFLSPHPHKHVHTPAISPAAIPASIHSTVTQCDPTTRSLT